MRRLLAPALLVTLAHCTSNPPPAPHASSATIDSGSPPTAGAPPDATERCRARIASLVSAPSLEGTPAFDAVRAEVLGRARGEPMVFVREPRASKDAEDDRSFAQGKPGKRVGELRARHKGDPRALRAALLREGYVYSPDPLDAYAIVSALHVQDLFDEPEIWQERGSIRQRLVREVSKQGAATYRIADGPRKDHQADLLFGDRFALHEAELARPLHRDLRSLAESEDFDRARVVHRTEGALVAELRFGDRWARAVIEADGAALKLACIAEDASTREAIEAWRAADAPRREALARLHETVTEEVDEALRFDRPDGEKTAEHDGELRPAWMAAYMAGWKGFGASNTSLPVFDSQGRPWPPQVCVDFVLDSYERTSGTWFRARGEAPARVRGSLDFDTLGITNRHGVLAFGKFAATHPALFEVRAFEGAERIPFAERARFFSFLVDHADEIRAGDVAAIQGVKADGKIHQHAILVERTDPLTGFAYGLADQMFKPRRRTWEDIMAEAPRRSLLYRAHPTDRVLGSYTAIEP